MAANFQVMREARMRESAQNEHQLFYLARRSNTLKSVLSVADGRLRRRGQGMSKCAQVCSLSFAEIGPSFARTESSKVSDMRASVRASIISEMR